MKEKNENKKLNETIISVMIDRMNILTAYQKSGHYDLLLKQFRKDYFSDFYLRCFNPYALEQKYGKELYEYLTGYSDWGKPDPKVIEVIIFNEIEKIKSVLKLPERKQPEIRDFSENSDMEMEM